MPADATCTVTCACPHDCPDTCSMLVEVKEGRAVSVRGNPEHLFTRGGLCVKVNNYEERVYSPDRILNPMRRVGAKGEGRFERISWDAALDEIGRRWRGIIDAEGPQAILPYSYLGHEGMLNGLNVGDPFFNALGATVTERTFCDSGSSTAYIMTLGPTPAVDPESLRHSRYIVLWACNTISTNLHQWPFIAEAQAAGAKVVVIDPVRTRTAKKADWHIPIRPGTDAALALGMINVIVAEGLVDRDYVERHTVGYDELAARAAEYTPERVEAITGVPADDVRRLAREYASSQPSMIRIGVAIERHASGGQAVRALCCLPALVGAWRKPGGGILQLPVWAFPMNLGGLMRPDLLRPGTRVLNQWRLGPALTGELGLDPPIRSIMVWNANPVVVIPEQEKVVRGLAREDLFTVVHEQFMTDTARYADILLPATTQLEQEDMMFSWGHLYLHYNPKAVEPLGEAVSNTELFRRLARTMGFADPFFQRSDAELVEGCLDWTAPALAGITLAEVKKKGWVRLNLPDAASYAPHAEGNFPTPSGKCEFVSAAAAGGNFVVPLFRQGSNEHQDGTPVDPLPAYREGPAVGAGELTLISPKSHAFLNSTYANLPQQLHHAGEQHVLLNPADAAVLEIEDGTPVRVANRHGAFEAIARIDADVMAGVAVAPLGYWRSRSRGLATVQAVTSPDFADLGRAPTFSDTRVEVVSLALAAAAE